MKKLVKENIEEFKRGQEPRKGLNIGRESAEMAEKRESERLIRDQLIDRNDINWAKKPYNLSEVHNKNYGATLVTDKIMQVLEDGAVEREGACKELLADEYITQAYLGFN